MIKAAISGRLGSDPVQRTTKSGTAMVTAAIVVTLNRPGEPAISEWFKLVAFGQAAELLVERVKGDTVIVSGVVTKSAYTARDGTEKQQWSGNIDGVVLSIRAAAPPRSERPPKAIRDANHVNHCIPRPAARGHRQTCPPIASTTSGATSLFHDRRAVHGRHCRGRW
jgi:single-stranded DNA-binding protein